MTRRARVGINGYGVIGKRVADAVKLQEDMELVGVADVVYDYRVRVAVERGYPVFASDPDRRLEMEAAGIPVAGTVDDLLRQAEVVVDCTPKRVGAQNRERYRAAGVKAVWQGGEKHDVAGYSVVAQVNYAGALDRESARVVSCNTTALGRVMGALHSRGWVKRARAVLLRRGTDPWESHINGMINTVIPETKVPSHQGPDATTVIPDLDITTLAGAGSHNLSHIHFAMVETTRPVTLDELRDALWDAPRIAFVRASDGLVALNSVVELMRDLGRPRGDTVGGGRLGRCARGGRSGDLLDVSGAQRGDRDSRDRRLHSSADGSRAGRGTLHREDRQGARYHQGVLACYDPADPAPRWSERAAPSARAGRGFPRRAPRYRVQGSRGAGRMISGTTRVFRVNDDATDRGAVPVVSRRTTERSDAPSYVWNAVLPRKYLRYAAPYNFAAAGLAAVLYVVAGLVA